ncbi:hypothetical protein OXPF_15620 [Oxobacter pfennigii]|uniref:Uncharacterized protein n=1 Tax=Oxobacter pfennigii TaxID=36849 RepID=A0A0P8YZ33_9CLOT|nr:DUF6674 family protein [Oxobacter pfennigii]KPU45084.1 hypothetical protein OXPF_15620 [Oxobacter pfennigii]
MSDTATLQSAALLENEHVKELLAILKENRVSNQDFMNVINYVGAMERQLDTAVNELIAMRRELSELRDQQSHPVRIAMQKAIRALEEKITETRARLESVKADIIEGCKNAVAAFREKGVEALHGLDSFLHIRQGLQAIRDGMDRNIQFDEQSMKKIAGISTEYHEAGKHVKNIGRAALGKETVQEAKPMGRLAKAMQAPYRLDRSFSDAIKQQAVSALNSLDKLEQRVQLQRTDKTEKAREKKPSILRNLQDLKEQAAQTPKKAPVSQQKKQEASL